MQDFRNLDVWTKAHAFTLRIYTTTESFPRAETFGLAATLRRSSAQIAMSIAEGCGLSEPGGLIKRLQHARAIAVEVEYQLLLARDLHFIEAALYDALQHQLIECRRMLSGLMKSLPV